MTTLGRAKPLRIAIGGFPALLDRGLAQILHEDQGLELVGHDLDVSALEGMLADVTRAPHVVILDETVALLPCVRRLATVNQDVRLLVLSYQPTRRSTVRLLAAGATACLSVDATAAAISKTVRLAAAGTQIVAATAGGVSRVRQPEGLVALTPREREVLGHLAGGRSRAEIASLLHVSIETVHSHVTKIYRKLGARGRADVLGMEIPLQ